MGQAHTPETRIDNLIRANEKKDAEIRRLRREVSNEKEQKEKLESAFNLVRRIDDANPTAPKWRKLPKKTARNNAIPTLLLSDLHLDEVVNPAEVGYYNAYSREIAEMRLEHTVKSAIKICRQYTAGIDFDGFILALGGDLISGDIHAELVRTNEATVYETIAHWVPRLAVAVETLADEFGSLYVPCVVGNHDRSPANRRPPAKKRATDALSWIVYRWLADRFHGDDRVVFEVAEGADLLYDVYDMTVCLTHGDAFRGGNGIAGLLSPVARGHAKRSQRQLAIGRPFDLLAMGHFHSYLWGRGFLVNGSMKGLDEYAYQGNFDVEKPQQALWFTVPEKGVTFQAPVFCEAPDEPWRKRARAIDKR